MDLRVLSGWIRCLVELGVQLEFLKQPDVSMPTPGSPLIYRMFHLSINESYSQKRAGFLQARSGARSLV